MSALKKFLILALPLLVLACATSSPRRNIAVSEPFELPNSEGVFASYEPLRAELSAPFSSLFKFRKVGHENLKDHPVQGTLKVNGRSYPVKLVMKGFSTALMCPFPKLEISVLDHEKHDRFFKEAKSFDLNTHCAPAEEKMDDAFKASFFNHREQILYRVLDILNMPAFRTRPAFFRYYDEDESKEKQDEHYNQAFLVEDTSAFTKRLDAEEVKGSNDPYKKSIVDRNPGKAKIFKFGDLQNSKMLDPEDAARIALFQEMIGNYDWFIKVNPKHMRSEKDPRNLWNIKIVELKNGKWVMFPQDFSLATAVTGKVNPTLYEKVFQSVSIQSQNKIKTLFLEKKSEILSLRELLDPQGKQYFDLSINKFFHELVR